MAGLRQARHAASVGLPRVFYAALAVILIGLVYELHEFWHMRQLGRALADPARIVVSEDTPPRLIFAKARWLEQTGEMLEALRLYHGLRHTKDRALREAVLYDLANAYLKEAAALWNSRGVLEYARVGTLVELAKENYRELLRLNPEHWGARHNLEYAYRITPPPREKPKADFQGRKSSVFATLPGLPGGGP